MLEMLWARFGLTRKEYAPKFVSRVSRPDPTAVRTSGLGGCNPAECYTPVGTLLSS